MKKKVNKNYPIIIRVNKDLDKDLDKYQNCEFVKKKVARANEMITKAGLPKWD